MLTVGRLVERKGFETVIRAMALVPDAECVVVGGPPAGLLETDPYARRLRALAGSCGVADRVRLVGAVPREEMPAAGTARPTWWSPRPGTSRSGSPRWRRWPAAYRSSAPRSAASGDTVVDGVTGELVPARDPQRPGRRAAAACSPTGSAASATRTAALQRARRSYSWATAADRLAEVYAEVAAVAPAEPGGRLMTTSTRAARAGLLDAHLNLLAEALLPYRAAEPLLARWGTELAGILVGGGRLLVAGNGGSAAEAQHLTAELVGRLRDDRQPLSAIALHAETSALTAIGNDYGYEEVFARQVRAHGRPGDVLLLMSTSGASGNLLAAVDAARETGLRCWAFTGPAPNPLAGACHEALTVASPDSQVVQELHLVSTHVLCEYVDRALPRAARRGGRRHRHRAARPGRRPRTAAGRLRP